MGLLSWLFGKPKTPSQPFAVIPPTGEFALAVVGEANYQEALCFICGGKTDESADRICDAVLIFENSNPYDSNAIRVDMQGMTVGYLSREHARQFRRRWKQEGLPEAPATCRAIIKGGWYRGPEDEGHYGVYLRWVDANSRRGITYPPLASCPKLCTTKRVRKARPMLPGNDKHFDAGCQSFTNSWPYGCCGAMSLVNLRSDGAGRCGLHNICDGRQQRAVRLSTSSTVDRPG